MNLRTIILASLERVDGCCLDNREERERVAATLAEDLSDALQLALVQGLTAMGESILEGAEHG